MCAGGIRGDLLSARDSRCQETRQHEEYRPQFIRPVARIEMAGQLISKQDASRSGVEILTLFYARTVRTSLSLVSPTRVFPPRSDGQLCLAGKARVKSIKETVAAFYRTLRPKSRSYGF